MTSSSGGGDGHLQETLLRRSVAFSGRLLHLFVDDVRLGDGEAAVREVVAHPGAVAVIARDEAGRFVLVRQWRHAVGRALWEIPAGTREPDEAEERTAARELREETGFSARDLRLVASAPVSPGYTSETLSFFIAEGLERGAAGGDADERVDVGLFHPHEVSGLLAGGQVDIKTMAGLALAGFPLGRDGG